MKSRKALSHLLFISAVPLVLLLGGCAKAPQVKYVHIGNDPSMVALNKIAEKAERSTQVLAQIQEAQADASITLQGEKMAQLANTATPIGWGHRTSVSYQGPWNKLLVTLATRAGYQYYEEGMAPANIKIVTIESRNKTLKHILTQVIAQMPAQATVAIHPTTRSMVVNYNGK